MKDNKFYVVTFKYKEDDIYPMCVTPKLNLCHYEDVYNVYDEKDDYDYDFDYESEDYIYDYERAKEVANKMKKVYPKGIIEIECIGE